MTLHQRIRRDPSAIKGEIGDLKCFTGLADLDEIRRIFMTDDGSGRHRKLE